MGILHFTPEPLSEEEAKSLIKEDDPFGPLDMDYVHGRSIKLHVTKEDGKLTLPDSWYDHTDEQYHELLNFVGVEVGSLREHGMACNCFDCKDQQNKPSE